MKVQDDVRRRSYNEPTLEDKFDKSQMPKPMQVTEAVTQKYTIVDGRYMFAATRLNRDGTHERLSFSDGKVVLQMRFFSVELHFIDPDTKHVRGRCLLSH